MKLISHAETIERISKMIDIEYATNRSPNSQFERAYALRDALKEINSLQEQSRYQIAKEVLDGYLQNEEFDAWSREDALQEYHKWLEEKINTISILSK